jgi:hypothetical protein
LFSLLVAGYGGFVQTLKVPLCSICLNLPEWFLFEPEGIRANGEVGKECIETEQFPQTDQQREETGRPPG